MLQGIGDFWCENQFIVVWFIRFYLGLIHLYKVDCTVTVCADGMKCIAILFEGGGLTGGNLKEQKMSL